MKTVTLPIATTLALLLAACAPQTAYEKFKAGQPLQNFPYKTGGTQAQTQRDTTNCQVLAANRVPQHHVIRQSPSFTTPVQTTCNRIGTQTFCNSTGGDTFGGQTYSEDANAGLRQRVFAQCMADQGYRYVNIPVCPAGVTLDSADRLLPLSRTTCYRMTADGRGAIGNY